MTDSPFLIRTPLEGELLRDTNKEAIGDSLWLPQKSHGDPAVTHGFPVQVFRAKVKGDPCRGKS